MSPGRFDLLLRLLGLLIVKQTTKLREPILAEKHLSVTLRYLTSTDSQISLSFSYRIGRSTLSSISKETCDAIYEALTPDYLPPPSSVEVWMEIAKDFQTIWNIPHVLGALDGKHIRIQCPLNTGTLFHNYKGFFSIVLLAICDAKYNFTLVDIGQYESNNNSGVLANSTMGKKFSNGTMNMPPPSSLERCSLGPLPCYLVGDEIFPLKECLLRPCPGTLTEEQKVFNYHLSRARRTTENSSGILTTRWRIFLTPIKAKVEDFESYVQAAVTLHNYLNQTESLTVIQNEYNDGENVELHDRGLISLRNVRGSRYPENLLDVKH